MKLVLTKQLLQLAIIVLIFSGCNNLNSSPEPISNEQAELKARLTAMQYKVTQEDSTEPPFNNEYWDNHEPGIYVDIVSGEPLFSSIDKFDTNTGWPSFINPLSESAITYHDDYKLGYKRTEIRSASADSHLGHLFKDGPAPTHDRYCINSAALNFIPLAELEKAGYGEYISLFSVK